MKKMTKEEAIKKIEEVVFQFQASLDEVDVDIACAEAEEDNRQVVEALDMAIKALEQEPREDATLQDIFCMGCEYKEQQPCEDAVEVWDGIHCQIVAPKGTFDKIYNDAEENEKAISVKDAIRVIKSWFEKIELNPDILIDSIISLPPVTPIRPKGEWETGYTYPDGEYWKCSECGELIKVKFPMNFCNSCGADMRSKVQNNNKVRGEKDAT